MKTKRDRWKERKDLFRFWEWKWTVRTTNRAFLDDVWRQNWRVRHGVCERTWKKRGTGLRWWGPEVIRKKAVKEKRKTVRIVGTQLWANRITNEKKSDKNDTTTRSRRRTTRRTSGYPWAGTRDPWQEKEVVPPAWERQREEVRWVCSIRARRAFLGHN